MNAVANSVGEGVIECEIGWEARQNGKLYEGFD